MIESHHHQTSSDSSIARGTDSSSTRVIPCNALHSRTEGVDSPPSSVQEKHHHPAGKEDHETGHLHSHILLSGRQSRCGRHRSPREPSLHAAVARHCRKVTETGRSRSEGDAIPLADVGNRSSSFSPSHLAYDGELSVPKPRNADPDGQSEAENNAHPEEEGGQRRRVQHRIHQVQEEE